MRKLWLFPLAVAACVAVGPPAPAGDDTRLMQRPAVGPKKVAFIYGEDLWTADLDGRNAKRLTTDIGIESYPVFSPDGSLIAFSAEYDGNFDVYTIPADGGSPTRLTYHPSQDIVRDFTPDGKSVLFTSNRNVHTGRHTQLFTVPLTGGMPTQLPIPRATEACYSPDGKYIAFTPARDASTVWKNYRGGTHSRIWIYDVATHDVIELPQPEGRCNDSDPNWVGDTLFFRSDRAGEYNVFAVKPNGKAPKVEDIKPVTEFKDFPVIDIGHTADRLIFEQAGYLHTMRPGETSPNRLKVAINTDAPEARARFVKGNKYVRDAAISPSGARVAVEFRGEIVTVPAEKGDPRNLTNSVGAHDRAPAWSPDGKTIAYFSDEGGEYQLVLAPQTGKGEKKSVKLPGAGFYYAGVWSRDSKKIAVVDNSSTIYWVDADSGKVTKVATDEHGRTRTLRTSSWSPDSKWLAYTLDTPAKISRVYVYSLDQNKSFPVTDGLTEAAEPVFDANGKYLYFVSSDSTGLSKHGFSQSAADARPPRFAVYLAVLQKATPSPFLRESDEEKGPAPAFPTRPVPPTDPREKPEPKPNDPKKDEPKVDEPKKDDKKPDEKKDEPKKDEPKAEPKAAPAKYTIDFDNIDQRIIALPIPSGNYGNLQTGAANQVFMLSRPEAGGGGRGPGGPGGGGGATLQRFNVEDRKVTTVQSGVGAYELTPDGRKMLYSQGGDWYVGNTGGGGGGTALAGILGGGRGGRGGAPTPAPAPESAGGGGGGQKLNLDAIEVRVDPRAEWKQIFTEAWRINRDFFYDPTMHGADWPAMLKKYEPFLEHATNGGDVYRVIGWMLSELAVGHSRYTPGERLNEKKTVSGGLLGADYEVANGRYRFKKIYSGLNYTSELRSPLTAPGVNVKEGEYLLAVRGVDLKPPTEVFSLFEGTGGKSIEITVGPNADGTGSRTVTVEPIAHVPGVPGTGELALRNREWIEGNLRKVEKATGGRVGYVYVPDTAGQGVAYFKRYFYPQIDKEALIIDERYNSGGQIADYYIEALTRPFASYWAPRYGAEWRSPSAAVHGPKVMIADEDAGSGGDMLPYMFKKFKVGPVVGKRTWGGLVGISGTPPLMDGGTVTAPSFAIWDPEKGFVVENEGVPPDVEVEQWPKDLIAGRDPQLEKAIELALEALKDKPKADIKRPPYPKRAMSPDGKPLGK
jgi:tricorn protease